MRTLHGIVFVVLSLGACVTEDEPTPVPTEEEEEDDTRRGELGEPTPVPVDTDEDELPDEGDEIPCFTGKNDHC